MANAELLWETLDRDWHRCGTTQCLGGFRCLMDGMKPYVGEDGIDGYTFVDADGECHNAEEYATARFDLKPGEIRGLLHCYSNDTAEFKERIQEIVDGKWRDEPRFLFEDDESL